MVTTTQFVSSLTSPCTKKSTLSKQRKSGPTIKLTYN